MELASYMLFMLGCLGAIDIALYHSIAHGIRSHPDSRSELLVPSLRGPTYATLFLLVPNFALHGLYFWGLIGLLLFDVAISILDFALEEKSRRFLGGLPTGEYILHILIAMLFGALSTAIWFEGSSWAREPTKLVYVAGGVPPLLRLVMVAMAALVLASGVQDLIAARQLCGQAIRSTSSPERELQA